MYRASFIIFIVTSKRTSNTMTVYILAVCLYYLYSYMFRHFHFIIREFTTNSLLSYTLSPNCSCW